jgi:uncharacterized cupredoxin-like copper-binding protein
LFGRTTRAVLVVAAISLAAAGCGSSHSSTGMGGMDHSTGSPTTVSAARTLDVTMADTRFDLARVDVRVGETVRFVFRNQGKLVHEAVIGTAAAQDAHEKQMAAGGGDMVMHEPGAVSIDPGHTAELSYTFAQAGQLFIGCHQPGHYAAGMKMTISVA